MAPEIQEYPRMVYGGKPQLDAAENAGAEKHLIVNNEGELKDALGKGYRLTPEIKKSSEPEKK